MCFVFDGWLFIVFLGWLDLLVGIYFGWVVVIDNNIDKNGRYWILVVLNFDDCFWLEVLCLGLGV